MTLLRRSIPRALLFVGIAAIATVSLGGTSTARATESAWLTIPGGLPLFDWTEIAPGDNGSARLTVTNPQSFAVNFSIAVIGLTNDDNGCNEPEQAIGDTTCGAGGGELQSDLRLSLTTTGSTDRPIADGTVDEWAAQPMVDPVLLGAYGTRTYRLGYELPIASTNITQSDLVSFQLEMNLDQSLGTVIASDPPAALVIATPLLAGRFRHTSGDHDRVVGSLAGLVLSRMSTRRRRAA